MIDIIGTLLGNAFLLFAAILTGAMLALYGVGLLALAVRLYYQESEPDEALAEG